MSSPSSRAFSVGVLDERPRRGVDRERHEQRDVDVGEVALLDERDRRDLAVGAGDLLDDRAADPADRDATPVAGPGRGCADVRLLDPAARTGRVDADEVDAELSRQLPHGRRGPHGVDRLGRDDGDERLRRGVRAGVAPLDRPEQLLSLLADHDEHGPDGRDLALLDEDLEHRPGSRRRDLDRRLVGLHLDQRIVLRDALPLRDEPPGDLGLGQPLAQVRQLELVGHGGEDTARCPSRPSA